MSDTIDWDALRSAAVDVDDRRLRAVLAFPVGAAALVDDGRVVVGCNVENASYGLTLCAECGLVSALHATGGGRLVARGLRRTATGHLLMPCGRCRQLLWEHGGPDCLLLTRQGARPMSEVLPDAFGAGRPRRGRVREPSRSPRST